MSLAAAASQPGTPGRRLQSMDSWLRSAEKPECISAAAERAAARGFGSAGQARPDNQRSFTVSQIASESQITSSPTCSAGTRPVGEYSTDPLLELRRVQRQQHFVEGDPELAHQQPGPQGPGGIVLVADDQGERVNWSPFSIFIRLRRWPGLDCRRIGAPWPAPWRPGRARTARCVRPAACATRRR